jgi:HTH-type transcriptional regulator, sugar sensing transcriptional regulator
MLEKDLGKLGLDDKESKVYLALLELGEANIEQIARKSKVKRTTVYDVIDSLKEKGMVSQVVKNKKTIFFAEDPRKFEEGLEERKHTLKNILPELLSIANRIGGKPKIKYFEGEEGINEIYNDTLRYSDYEMLVWGSMKSTLGFGEDFLLGSYVPRRLKQKIWVRAIAPDSPLMRKYQSLDEKSLRKTKLIKESDLPLEVEIDLYAKNKIAIMSFEENIGLIVESQKIFTTLKSIFEMNWQSLP